MKCLYLSWSTSAVGATGSTSRMALTVGSSFFLLLGVSESSSLLFLLLGVSALLSSSSSSSSLPLPSWLLLLPGLSKTFLKCANCTSWIASSASSTSTNLLSLALACAVDNLMRVSRALAVTGWVLATPLSKSFALRFAYSSASISLASSVSTGFIHLAMWMYFFMNWTLTILSVFFLELPCSKASYFS